MFYNVQTILPTELVGYIAHILVIFFGAVVFDTVHEGYRIHYKVIVNVGILIQMRTDKHLVSVAPDFLRQLNSNLMRKLRCNFTLFEGLVAVVGNCAIFLMPLSFYS